MFKYHFLAGALRIFSFTPGTQRLYAYLRKLAGQRRKLDPSLPASYIQSANYILDRCQKYPLVKDGYQILDIGTGWIHWGALIIRLFYDIRATLFDIRDNRNLTSFKHYALQTGNLFGRKFGTEPERRKCLDFVSNSISRLDTFEQIYQALNFHYDLDPTGSLRRFAPRSFDLVLSVNVLEHIQRDHLAEYIEEMYRVLRPGGYAIHQIELADHLSQQIWGVSLKNYYRYSDKTWRRWFENKVSYFNRVQCPDWVRLFSKAGFERVEEERISGKVGNLPIHPQYAHLSQQDQECLYFRVIYRKTLRSPSN